MYVVRRHSRKLFFPAGLLALAWLLCLGCMVLAGQPQPQQYGVKQVSVVPLHRPEPFWSDGRRINFAPKEFYASPAQLAAAHSWFLVRFTGNPWQDNLSVRTASFLARQLLAFPKMNWGLRIQFDEGSQYGHLVAMLDTIQVVGIKRQWLDMRQQRALLYSLPGPVEAFNSKPSTPILGQCVVYEPVEPAPIPEASVQDLALNLLNSAWRYAALLLLLLPLASLRQLRHLTRLTPTRR